LCGVGLCFSGGSRGGSPPSPTSACNPNRGGRCVVGFKQMGLSNPYLRPVGLLRETPPVMKVQGMPHILLCLRRLVRGVRRRPLAFLFKITQELPYDAPSRDKPEATHLKQVLLKKFAVRRQIRGLSGILCYFRYNLLLITLRNGVS